MEINQPVELVQSVMAFYYKTVRQKLTELEEVNIQLENLGKFYIKERAVNKTIERYTLFMQKLSDSNIKHYEIKLSTKKKVEMMSNILNKLLHEKQRRKEVINKRFNNETGS